MSTNTYPWNEWIPGALNDSQLAELIDAGIIENAVGCAPDFSSFDLTLDDDAYEMVQGSVKPQGGGYEQFLRTEGKYARRLKFDSDQTAVLNPQKTYVFKLREMLSTKLNVSNIHGQATAKSSVGTHVWHSRSQARGLNGEIGHGRSVVTNLHCQECRLGAPVLRALAQEITQRVKNPRLVILEGDHATLIS
jgi:hypothetical protein